MLTNTDSRNIEMAVDAGPAPVVSAGVPGRLLELMLDNIAVGAALWDAHNKLVAANAQFYTIFGLQKDNVPAACDIVDFSELAVASDCLSGREANEVLGAHMAIVMRNKDSRYLDEWPNGTFVVVSYRKVGEEFWLASYEDVTQSRKAEEAAKKLADYDSLTQLYNRRFFHDRLKESLARGHDIAVFYVDLDRFKEVNDSLGHPFGDAILKAAASRLLGCFRRDDIVARLGGDEFAVIIAGSGEKEALLALARRLILKLSGAYTHAGRQVAIGASVGIARSRDGGANPDKLLSHADMALYSAKKNGKGRPCFFETSMNDEVDANKKVEENLASALTNHEMSLLYQPIIDIAERRVFGAEALLRWKSQSLGNISPTRFIPVAESSGQIVEIGSWVIRKALSEAVRWRSSAGVSINISPAQFHSEALIGTIKNALERTGIRPSKVTFEITESVLMKNNEQSKGIINKMRELGTRVALDDFGIGYSSLSYLVDFKFDKVKMDKSFIDRIGHHAPSEAVVRSVIRMTSDMGIDLIAEGVETKEQLTWLSENKCRYIQGFLFSRPVASDKISNWQA